MPQMSEEIRMRIQQFSEVITTGDMLIRVMRAQLYMERQLLTIIEGSVKNPERLPERLEYSLKLKLCEAFGLNPELSKPVAAIGRFRNDYAHFADYELTDEELKFAFQTFEGAFLRRLEEQMMRMLAGTPQRGITLKELPAPDAFSLLALTVWTELVKETGRLANVSADNAILKPFPARKKR